MSGSAAAAATAAAKDEEDINGQQGWAQTVAAKWRPFKAPLHIR